MKRRETKRKPSDALTREEVTAEMNSRYSKIFSFVSGDNISLQAQTTADDSGNMVADDAIISLSADITETSSTDLQKAEAIYIWIVENIYFDSDYANGITTETKGFEFIPNTTFILHIYYAGSFSDKLLSNKKSIATPT